MGLVLATMPSSPAGNMVNDALPYAGAVPVLKNHKNQLFIEFLPLHHAVDGVMLPPATGSRPAILTGSSTLR
ncbi:MAG: hypothetical protein JJ908_06490 [Rhizobiales bacterium]|nr:hypothetical protein [Hyphomicrobiales bacterium]MBO6697747.1 hypothetical protein [Hyphomicrobiales bacterium]MBO6735998.1 hypothetical protein [Hyphomicrobiales bacterium]MBO6912468.1 hypothetical protein [Hyphomicrobiales bacterium]MBO6955099.1 hypothetical protein [Hyphomicrobiales bacterium]